MPVKCHKLGKKPSRSIGLQWEEICAWHEAGLIDWLPKMSDLILPTLERLEADIGIRFDCLDHLIATREQLTREKKEQAWIQLTNRLKELMDE